MKCLFTAAIMMLAASLSASAQVYGTNDNPYDANPFASNMVVPQDSAPAPAAAAASEPAAQQDSSRTQQQAAASTPSPGAKQDTKKEKQP
jgi:hypothetical protein